ncbi:MAG: hypothetical protein GWN31_07450 [Candidatus Thorarchaeota archaeon]|nr:hypothetical protein [Candidatus Thorarchaeota archaeon]NIW51849.1 hypothetical protein [Candidatus Korarchaeota archaeon]
MKILAFDPGGTTGVVLLDTTSPKIFNAPLTFPQELYQFLGDSVVPGCVDHIVIEQFRLYSYKAQSKSWSDFPEIRAQGAIEYAAYQAGIVYTLQPPSTAKQAIQDGLLKEYGFYKGYAAHERDALRHALTYLLRFAKEEFAQWRSLL